MTAIAPWGHDQDIARRHRLGFMRRPPMIGDICEVILARNRTAFEAALARGAEALRGRSIATAMLPPAPFARDGKAARGSCDGLHTAVHRPSLMAHGSRLTPARTTVPNGAEEKTNEHKRALRLWEGLPLFGLA